MKGVNYDRRITLERGGVSDDGFSQVETWEPLAEVWAEVDPISDGERWRAGEVGASVTHRFRIRYSTTVADLNPRDRLTYEGRAFDIGGVKEMGRREGLEITASARADQ